MRLRLVSLGVLAAALSVLGAEASAAERVVATGVPAIGPGAAVPNSSRVVIQVDQQHLKVLTPGRPAREIATPGCTFVGRISASEAFCNGPASVDLTSGDFAPVRVQPVSPYAQYFDQLLAAGSRWLLASVFVGGENGGSPLIKTLLVRRSDGKAIDLSGQFGRKLTIGKSQYLDLEAKRPVQSLCAPVRRQTRAVAVQVIGRWTMRPGPGGAILQRCGTTAKQVLPSRAILGRGHAAWVSGNKVALLSLATGRRQTFRLPSPLPAATQLAFSRARLVVSQRVNLTSDHQWTVTQIPFPR